MSPGNDDLLRNVTREVLAELLPDLLEEALAIPTANGNGNGHRSRPPAVLAPTGGDAVVPRCRPLRSRRSTARAAGARPR